MLFLPSSQFCNVNQTLFIMFLFRNDSKKFLNKTVTKTKNSSYKTIEAKNKLKSENKRAM